MSADLDDPPDPPTVVPVRGFAGRLLPGAHPIEHAERAAIRREWERALADRPRLFDGRVLLAETIEIRDGRLEVAFREIGFSTMIWRRTLPPAARPLVNVFGAAAVISADGAALLGRMGKHTANAGRAYFPAGTPDLSDLKGDVVDVDGSIARELAEETGLGEAEACPSERRFAVLHGPLAAYVRVYLSGFSAEALAAKVRAHIAAEAEPELSEPVIVRPGDAPGAEVPPYARAALRALFGAGGTD